MKDNISIIFAAIIGTFLIVILPLFSILDRQDSMSYNVVLTATTNFVDKVRNNGFIDMTSYNDYIASLASTSNTYKVTIEAYRKKLIHDTDENGNILADRFSEEKELINTYDILNAFANDTNIETSNKKGNVYLFNENDEIYIKVKNTNLTAGSLMYRFLSGITNTNVINISYGGVINNINWEMYENIQSEQKDIPEVVMTVPVNDLGKTNITKIKNSQLLPLEDMTESELSEEEINISKQVGYFLTGKDYAYLYDLTKSENKTIRFSLELKNIEELNVVSYETKEEKLIALSELMEEKKFKDVKDSILEYIELNGMHAYKDIELRKGNDFYFFEVTLTNVRMSSLDYISSIASITVRPGLGQDVNGVLSLGTESVKLELMDESSVNSVVISEPYNFKKLKESTLKESAIKVPEVFVGQDLAFVISYTGINEDIETVVDKVRDNLNIYNANHSEVKYYTLSEFITEFGESHVTEINTGISNHIIVVFRYNEKNISNSNYIELNNDWIATNIDYDEEEIEEAHGYTYARGAKSTTYAILIDEVAPVAPEIVLDGTLGENGWYISNVNASMIPSKADLIKRSESYLIEDLTDLEELNDNIVGGVGIYKNYISMSGANALDKTEYIDKIELTSDGETQILGYAKDYLENEVRTKKTIVKIDKTAPTKPVITAVETKENKGNNGWYKGNVEINITPGNDTTSGVLRTTYSISGANELSENVGTSYTLTKEGVSVVTARTYDNAGNYSETSLEIKIDKTIPASADIQVISGSSHGNDWYYTDVELKVTLSSGGAVSELGISKYRVKEKNSTDDNYIDFNESEKNISITESGEYTVTVITYTKAGNTKTKEINIKIDKEAPKPVTISASGTFGQNDWYTSSVDVALTSNGDNGPSGEVNYIRYTLDNDNTEIEVQSGKTILFEDDNIHTLTVYSIDNAGNRTKETKTIKIDRTKPSAEFVITGDKGQNGWYTSDVNISYENAVDLTSGISSINLTYEKLTDDTTGEDVTLTIIDNAGNINNVTRNIKIDKTKPTEPTIMSSSPTGSGLPGVLLSNVDVQINIVPGTDETSLVDKTTYKVTKIVNEQETVIISEQEYTGEYIITQNGYYIVCARTYDKAGNYSETSKVIWVNKTKPGKLVLNSINEESVIGLSTKTVIGNDSNLKLTITGYEVNNTVSLRLTNLEDYNVIQQEFFEINNGELNVTLPNKGKYAITLTQTNMFGSTSDTNDGTYYYIYE